jgi:hypothetical protein
MARDTRTLGHQARGAAAPRRQPLARIQFASALASDGGPGRAGQRMRSTGQRGAARHASAAGPVSWLACATRRSSAGAPVLRHLAGNRECRAHPGFAPKNGFSAESARQSQRALAARFTNPTNGSSTHRPSSSGLERDSGIPEAAARTTTRASAFLQRGPGPLDGGWGPYVNVADQRRFDTAPGAAGG